MKYKLVIIISLFIVEVYYQDFNVKDFGAKGDGITNDQRAIDAAIRACSKAENGRVIFEEGTFLTSTIHLKSNVTLYIRENALILGAKDGYDAFELNPCQSLEFHHKRFEGNYQDFGHSHFRNALFYARGERNIKIIGEGEVDYTNTDLDNYRKTHHIHINAEACKSGNFVPSGLADKCFSFVECEDIELFNLNVVGGGHFTLLPKDCNYISFINCWFDGQRDGFNIDDCKNVLVKHCFMDATDDAFCLKSDCGTCRKLYCENILIDSCIAKTRCWALKFGASESYNAFRNVTYSNIRVIEGGKGGIGLLDGQGADIINVIFKNIILENCNLPIYVGIGYGKHHMNPADNGPGKVRNLTFENIIIRDVDPYSRSSVTLVGHPESGPDGIDGIMENVTLKNIKFMLHGDELLNVNPNREIPGWVKFEETEWAGFNGKYIDGLTLENLSYDFETSNTKPLIKLENMKNVTLKNITTTNSKDSEADVVIKDVEELDCQVKSFRIKKENELKSSKN